MIEDERRHMYKIIHA